MENKTKRAYYKNDEASKVVFSILNAMGEITTPEGFKEPVKCSGAEILKTRIEERKNFICHHICGGCKCMDMNRFNNCSTLQRYMDCYRLGFTDAEEITIRALENAPGMKVPES